MLSQLRQVSAALSEIKFEYFLLAFRIVNSSKNICRILKHAAQFNILGKIDIILVCLY